MQSSTPQLKDTIVRAGAGAGKTTGLVQQVVDVFREYSRRGETPRLIVTTFTRKATQELKERLILRACKEQDPRLLQFVTDTTRLHISTIHGLLNLFMRQVGHLAGLDTGFEIISETEAGHLARLTLREVLVENLEGLRWLEIYGFERVLKMCRLFQEFQSQQGELRPAGEKDLNAVLEERSRYWRRAFEPLLEEISQSTSDESWMKFAAELKGFLRDPYGEPVPSKPRKSKKQADLESLHETAELLLNALKKDLEKPWSDRSLWPDMIREWSDFAPFANTFASKLGATKEKQARFEMTDLELKSLEILRSHPFLATVFSEAWNYWMIDEYQDTSPLQVAVLQALAAGRPKYLVGDPQQSIYLFRGSDVTVFTEAEETIRASGGSLQERNTNYRSTPNLLMWINDFMGAHGSQFQRMEPRSEPAPHEKGGAQAMFWHAPTEEAEREGIVARVAELLESGARLEQICVIGRTHRTLMDVSATLKKYGYPTHVHAARGFSSRREVTDAHALWKFLLNPHDNLNLLVLHRSPWFFVEDWRLTEWMESRPNSLWYKLMNLPEIPEAVARLKAALELSEREGLVRGFEQALCVNGYLDLCLENDPAGRKESNLWKLISKAQDLAREGGQSLLNLIERESEDPMEANEGDATSAQEPNCINLMTIHGSKGLQFDHVIIPCMGDAPRLSQTPVFQSLDAVFTFPVWFESVGETQFVPSPLDFSATRARKERELEESDRWLYVAVTRAKQSVTLCWSDVARESWVDRNPWFSRPAGEHQTADYSYRVLEEMPAPVPYRGGQRELTAVRPPFVDAAERVMEKRRSVSDLVQAEQTRRLDNKRLLGRWEAQTTGTRIHRALEAVKYGQPLAMSDKEEDAVKFVLELQDPPLKDWIENGEVEWGFQVLGKSGVIEGQIDLWCKHEGRLYVVDYKSGSMENKEAAFQQLSLYAWALRKFGHKEPATLVVIYPLARKIETRAFEDELFSRWERELGGP